MKNVIYTLVFVFVLAACHFDKNITTKAKTAAKETSDTVRIANDVLEYEVVIIDPGFNSWLVTQAQPRGFYSETFLENRNAIYASEWNSRVRQSQSYNRNLYEMEIDYNQGTHYGYEVNYLIYNYFVYFQIANRQRLAAFAPRP
jgi:hypothetical protein